MTSGARLTSALAIALVIACSSNPPIDPPPPEPSVAGSIDGTVEFEGSPLPGTSITINTLAGRRIAVSQADGTWAFREIPAGRYSVVCELPGFRQKVVPVDVPAGTTARVVCPMTMSAVAEEISVVTAPSPALDSVRIGRSNMGGVVGGMIGGRLPGMTQPMFPRQESFNTEEYSSISENGFRLARNEPLSTFSIDVDTASYSNVRRFIRQRQRPPRDAVRIEEMINYFNYDYPAPESGPFSVSTEIADCPWNPRHRLVQIGVQAQRVDTRRMPPNNLVFLIDVSGSMKQPDKLPLLVSSLRLLVETMRPQDRVAIVVYAGSEGLLLPSTSGDRKGAILSALDSLEAGGTTAGAAGIRLAYRVAREQFDARANNRVILATDGDFNVGVSSESELQQIIEAEREQGVFLSVLGYGTGNIKDNKMETLADRGNGNYSYIDSLHEARKVLVEEMGGTLLTLAKDVKIQVEFNPQKVGAYRLVGYENRLLANEDFNDDRKDAGELGAGHSVTALYEIVPAGQERGVASVDELRYQSTQPTGSAFGSELMQLKVRYKEPQGSTSRLISRTITDRNQSVYAASENLRFAAAVAQFGMLLRESEHKGEASFTDVLALARSARGADREGYRSEFIELVETASRME